MSRPFSSRPAGADAVEILSQTDDRLTEYYRYLNSGYRLPLVGGTDKMSSAVPVGLYRTYARLDEEFSYEAWCRAVRSGRTFLSGGPLVTLSVDGCQPGDTTSPGWNGRSPRPCARWKSAATDRQGVPAAGASSWARSSARDWW
ncbi:MAG TPA: hypothetical protein VFW50_41905 [Streptosporangiaceae bacterium]|nr:hypothetical protein [Streptosporangiaceae bacterium]